MMTTSIWQDSTINLKVWNSVGSAARILEKVSILYFPYAGQVKWEGINYHAGLATSMQYRNDYFEKRRQAVTNVKGDKYLQDWKVHLHWKVLFWEKERKLQGIRLLWMIICTFYTVLSLSKCVVTMATTVSYDLNAISKIFLKSNFSKDHFLKILKTEISRHTYFLSTAI